MRSVGLMQLTTSIMHGTRAGHWVSDSAQDKKVDNVYTFNSQDRSLETKTGHQKVSADLDSLGEFVRRHHGVQSLSLE